MNKILSHVSAAKYWDIPNLDSVLGVDCYNTDILDFTVQTKGQKYNRKGCNIYFCKRMLPKRSVLKDNNLLVASPELTFLQLSTRISLHRLILLGLQLCSCPPGEPSKSITTKRKLQNFIDKTPGHFGQANSRRALKYIEDGSASIMESLAFMILTLPNLLGGYGLNGAYFNYEIPLKSESYQLLKQRRCFVDIFYRQEKVAVEYDSFSYHNSPLSLGKDAIRSQVLNKLGFEIMHLNTIQLYNLEACDDFAKNLAKRLNRRLNIRTDKYILMRNSLRSLLPKNSHNNFFEQP